MNGVDVSEFEGKIDWKAARDAGLQFALLRCGYGSNVASQDDPTFLYNARQCELLGIPYGMYLYSYALNLDDAQSELEHILRLAKDRHPLFPVYIDMEDADGYKAEHGMPSRQMITEIVRLECSGLAAKGYLSGYYTNESWYNNHIFPEQLTKYEFWYAYPGQPSPNINCGVWQNNFPSTGGKWPGINDGSNCDTDISFADYPQTVKAKSLNNWLKDEQPALNTTADEIYWTKCVIDTTMPLTKPVGSCYTVEMWCSQQPTVTAGTGGVVCVCPVTKNGSGSWLCNLVGYGSGASGIYTYLPGEPICKRFVFTAK